MGSMTKPSPSPDLGRTTRNPAFSWQVVSALVLVVLAIGVAVTLGLINNANPVVATGPVPVATVGQPGADSAACKTLMPKLPAELAGSARRPVQGGGDGIAAWGDPAVILRCGLETPQELNCSAALTQVDQVAWLQLANDGLPDTTYLAADRSVRIAVTLPDGTGTAAIQQISDVVSANLPARQPSNKGVLLPTDTR
jgi:hypothetical protein